jgi:hypothetical protein
MRLLTHQRFTVRRPLMHKGWLVGTNHAAKIRHLRDIGRRPERLLFLQILIIGKMCTVKKNKVIQAYSEGTGARSSGAILEDRLKTFVERG